MNISNVIESCFFTIFRHIFFALLALLINPDIPCNYYPNDDPTQAPIVRWRSVAHLLFANWLNYYVYQGTPYELERMYEEESE